MRVMLNKSQVWVVLGLVGLIATSAVFAAGGSAGSQANSASSEAVQASPEASPGASPVASATNEVIIDIAMMDFQTKSIEVPVGTTVTWVNKDVVAHTVTHQPTSGDVLFDSGYFESGESWSYTFEEEGTFDYYCIPHPFMIGTIVVVAP